MFNEAKSPKFPIQTTPNRIFETNREQDSTVRSESLAALTTPALKDRKNQKFKKSFDAAHLPSANLTQPITKSAGSALRKSQAS
jgi:hypothetical protein